MRPIFLSKSGLSEVQVPKRWGRLTGSFKAPLLSRKAFGLSDVTRTTGATAAGLSLPPAARTHLHLPTLTSNRPKAQTQLGSPVPTGSPSGGLPSTPAGLRRKEKPLGEMHQAQGSAVWAAPCRGGPAPRCTSQRQRWSPGLRGLVP